MSSDMLACRERGWYPVSALKAHWESSSNAVIVMALRQARVDIDDLIEDAWGPESGLKFWNPLSGEYSHAADWAELAKEINQNET